MKNNIKKLKKTIEKHNLALFAFLVFAVIIFYFSVIPVMKLPGIGSNSGFIAHSLSYAVLSFTLALHLILKKTRNPLIKTLAIIILLGLFIEIVQFFIPYRNLEAYDILINSSAAFLGVVPYFVFVRLKFG